MGAIKNGKTVLLAFVAVMAVALATGMTPLYAQKQGGAGAGGPGGSGSGHTDQADSGHSGGSGSKASQRGGQAGARSGGGGQSLRDIFHDMESGSGSDKSSTEVKSEGKGKKGPTTAAKKPAKTAPKAAEDSGRPAWAGVSGGKGKAGSGNAEAGTKKGDIYGDMYVLLRDANGVPIMIQLPDGTWVVQPVDASGNPLPLDAEGALINPELAIAVELGRLNVGRSPLMVLSAQYEAALEAINAADTVTLDASGRLVLTTDGVVKTIDSPLANLSLYVEIMNTGTITGVIDPTKFSSISYLVDGTFTTADFTAAASFLAAASDKASSLTIDKVVEMNTILGITGTLTDASNTGTYVDYSTFTYDRLSVYGTTTVLVLVKQPDGSYVPTTVNVYDAVFASTNYTSTDGGVDGFAQAADDALAIIEFVHNYSVPE